VICLDVLRAIAREPTLPALLAEIRLARGADRRLDAALNSSRPTSAIHDSEIRARDLVARLAIALQASLLLRAAPAPVADAYCASRLAGAAPLFGALPAGTDFATISRERCRPSDQAMRLPGAGRRVRRSREDQQACAGLGDRDQRHADSEAVAVLLARVDPGRPRRRKAQSFASTIRRTPAVRSGRGPDLVGPLHDVAAQVEGAVGMADPE